MLSLLRTFLRAKSTTKRPPPAWLRLESLEVRDVPANNIWQGLTSDFTDPSNWSLNRAPLADDVLVFDGDISTMSTTLSYPAPSGPGGGVGGVGGPGGTVTASLGYAGLRLIDDYSGTVTLPYAFTFGEFEQECGQIAQPNSASDEMTVTGSFSWTGGILNNTSNTGTVKLVGVANALMGAEGTQISTGSTISLESYGANGTTLQHDGTVIFNNEADLDVYSACQLMPKPQANPLIEVMKKIKTGRVEDKEKNLITVYIGGVYKTEGGVETDMGLIADGGQITVAKGSEWTGRLKATGRTGALPDSPSIEVKRGKLIIRNGETVEATNGVLIGQTGPTTLGAELLTQARSTEEGDQTATIDGKVTVLSGLVTLGLGTGGANGAYSVLHVTDNFELLGGSYTPWVSTTDTTKKDLIHSDKKINLTSAATVAPQFTGTPGQGVSWDVLEAVDGLVTGSTGPQTTTGWSLVYSTYSTNGMRVGVRKD